ncbi:MAG: nucleotidyltransferase family protein [Geminicoccaceae bacterium]
MDENRDRIWIEDLLRRDDEAMACLRAVRGIGNGRLWIGAGFIRNRVWDHLHGYARPTPLNDIDVLGFEPDDPEGRHEERLEERLNALLPGRCFEVRNQARMHERHGDPPYSDIADALAHWMETPTAVAVRMNGNDHMEFVHPVGLGDLMDMIVRPTPARACSLAGFDARMAKKRWPEIWPMVRIRREPPEPALKISR